MLQDKNHLYEIERNFVNPMVQITQLYMYIGVTMCEFCFIPDYMHCSTVMINVKKLKKLKKFNTCKFIYQITMEAILDELKQYNLKRIYDIKNIDFECEITLNNKYYAYVQFCNNIIISICVFNRMDINYIRAILRYENKHLYEIEHNFEIKNIYDAFYNFCLNNFVNPIVKQLHMHIVHNMCIIRATPNNITHLTIHKTILNLNELNLFHNAINKHNFSTIIRVLFEQN
jgi:hypothetical protein